MLQTQLCILLHSTLNAMRSYQWKICRSIFKLVQEEKNPQPEGTFLTTYCEAMGYLLETCVKADNSRHMIFLIDTWKMNLPLNSCTVILATLYRLYFSRFMLAVHCLTAWQYLISKTRDELNVFKSKLIHFECIFWVFKCCGAFYTLSMCFYISALASVRNLLWMAVFQWDCMETGLNRGPCAWEKMR